MNRRGEPVAGVRAYALGRRRSPTGRPGRDLACRASTCSTPPRRRCARASGRSSSSRPASPRSAAKASSGRSELLALVRAHGARLIGPNCLGIAIAGPSLNATFAARVGAAREHRLLVAERRARLALLEAAEARGLGLSGVRLDRQQGRRLVERPARVVGGRRGDGRRPALRRVVRQPAPLRSPCPPRRTPQADARAQERHVRDRPARRQLAHRGARGLGGRRRRALPPGGRDPGRLARGADRRRRAALQPAGAEGPAGRRADERRRARHPVRRRVRGGRARAAAALRRRRSTRLRALLPAEASVANPVDMLGAATAATYARGAAVAPRRPARRRGDRALRPRRHARPRTRSRRSRSSAARAASAPREAGARRRDDRRPGSRVRCARGRRAAFAYPESAARALGRAARARRVAAAAARHRAALERDRPAAPREAVVERALAGADDSVARSGRRRASCSAPTDCRSCAERVAGRRRDGGRGRRGARPTGGRQVGRRRRAQDGDRRRRTRSRGRGGGRARRRSGSASP